MRYHEIFWATVGAGAPVIALAITVSVTDVLGKGSLTSRVLFRTRLMEGTDEWEQEKKKSLVHGRWWAFAAIGTAMVNGCLQLAAFSLALGSLAGEHDVVALIVPELMLPLGIFLLAAGSVINFRVGARTRDWVERFGSWSQAGTTAV